MSHLSVQPDTRTKLHDDYTFITIDTSDMGFKSFFSMPMSKKASIIHSMMPLAKTPISGEK